MHLIRLKNYEWRQMRNLKVKIKLFIEILIDLLKGLRRAFPTN